MNTEYAKKIAAWRAELDKVVSGYDHIKDQLIVAMLAQGHVALRAVPGTAKTTLAKTLSKTIDGAVFARFQMTPDTKPSDILGVEVYNQKDGSFTIKKGKMVGANIVLDDEINRTTPKTLSAKLEAMQEGTITIGGETFKLEDVFFDIATLNPVEQEGTFPLPEATLDRFAMLIDMRYVSRADEIKMLRNTAVHGRNAQAKVQTVVSITEIAEMRAQVEELAANASDSLLNYIVDLVRATRPEDESFEKVHAVTASGADVLDAAKLRKDIMLGASPRAEIWTLHCAAANAFINGRDAITPDDVKKVFRDVLRHRILLNPVALLQKRTTDQVISAVLERVHVIQSREMK